MTFEEKMNELEIIIDKLENGNTKFDEATSLFERGATLCKEINKELETVKGKVSIIREEMGTILEEEFKY